MSSAESVAADAEKKMKNIMAQRRGHKAYATKIMNDAQKLIGESSKSKKAEMLALRKLLTERLCMIESLDNEILPSMDDEDEIEKEIVASGGYRMRIEVVLVELSESIDDLTIIEMDEKEENGSNHSAKSTKSESAKLPKLHLKTFSGDVLMYQEFWESYRSAIHDNSQLDKVTKFNYLRSLLQGAAAASISGLPLSAENYDEAVNLLKSRYGNKQVLISAHIEKLLTLPVVTSANDVKKLREVYDSIEINVRSLKSLDITIEHYGPILVSIVMSKLPSEIRLLITRSMATVINSASEEEWKIDELLKYLKQELESREMCHLVSNNSRESKLRNTDRHSEDFTASSLVTGTADNTYVCIYCGKNHSSSKCDAVTDVSVRKSILLRKGRCFLCLKPGHILRYCKVSYKCVKCKGRHNVSICERPPSRDWSGHDGKTSDPEAKTKQATWQVNSKIVNSNVVSNRKSSTFLQTAKATVYNIEKRCTRNVRVLFDGCSQKSFIAEKVRESLNLRSIRKERMIVRGFGSKDEVARLLDVVKVKLWDVSETMCTEVDVYVVPFICSPLCDQNIELAQATYEHLISLKLADSSDGEAELKIDLLIGADFYWEFVTGKMISGDHGPVALNTTLGWVLSGKMVDTQSSTANVVATHVMIVDVEAEADRSLDGLVTKFWKLDSVGILDEQDDVNIVEKFKENVKFDGLRYTVRLPWKECTDILPDNFLLCKGRLNSLVKRLRSDPNLLEEYDNIIKQQEADGIVEDVKDKIYEIGNVHYIPHREVIRKDRETSKMRIVYDASAKVKNGISLNDCLETGPCMLPKIFDVVVRFRCFKYALTSDIKSAFLNIRVDEKERDFLRFLWIDDVKKENPEIIIKRFTSVIFGVSSSPFLLNMTISTHMAKFVEKYGDVVKKFLRDLYMDDSVTGAQTEDEAFDLYFTCKNLMKQGGFTLRKWRSNDENLRGRLATCENDVFNDYACTKGDDIKVLGVNWDINEDTLFFSVEDVVKKAIAHEGVVNKRFILKTVSSIFDPLGVLAPVVLRFKLIFQEMCLQKYTWDGKIGEELFSKWKKLLDSSLKLNPIRLPRSYLAGHNLLDVSSVQLHGFCDASAKAYAAVIYLRIKLRDESILNQFVASKTRVAPVKPMTIPRLELMGCLILSRLIKTILGSIVDFQIDSVYCWSDSSDCIYWVKTVSKVWKRFVQNRVKEIRGNVTDAKWRHCPGNKNPADIHSRGIDINPPEIRIKWLEGPEFLRHDEPFWPPDIEESSIGDEHSIEHDVIATVNSTANCTVNSTANCTVNSTANCTVNSTVSSTATTIESNANLDDVINKHSFHSFAKLITVTCYVKRFVNNLKATIKGASLNTGEITIGERTIAERMWLLNEQRTIDSRKMRQLEVLLGAYKDNDGLVMLRGRLENSDLNVCSKFPIFIPKESYVGKLIIWDSHKAVLHLGTKDTLNEVRDKYWIVQGRVQVQNVLKRCYLCRKYGAKLLQKLPAAPLPDFRVQCCRPFTHTGIDYLGPLFVYSTPSSKTSTLEKVHVVLYTCANARAVHLDVVPDASSSALVNSLRRFISRRGSPKLFISDNAKCFVGPELKKFLRVRNIAWQFILEVSPWWGGFWERLVQIVKRPLRKILRRTSVSYDELLTIITEIECIVNCRPLCYLYSDNVEEVLTPSHLMTGKRILSTNCATPTQIFDENAKTLNNRCKYLTSLIEHFERRWKKEYLTELREYQRCNNRLPAKQVKIGDIVLINDENLPRSRWRMGKVEELFKGKDGYVRGCKLRVYCARKKVAYLNRPINKLCFFEVSSAEAGDV